MLLLSIDLLTNHLAETKAFYTERMGLKPIEQHENSVSFQVGSSILSFRMSTEIPHPNYHYAFNIPHNQFQEAVAWACEKFDIIRNHENEIVTDFPNWNAKSIYFYDNNENILELIARFDLNNTSDLPFSGASLLSISEAGIVTDDPLGFGENLLNGYGIPFFSRGPKREDFCAMGTDEGLFVISKSTRNWYPTNHRAEKFPMKLKVEIAGKVAEINVDEK